MPERSESGDPMKAFGAVIGKALQALNMSRLIPMFIALQ
jgi:hypothetical protein